MGRKLSNKELVEAAGKAGLEAAISADRACNYKVQDASYAEKAIHAADRSANCAIRCEELSRTMNRKLIMAWKKAACRWSKVAYLYKQVCFRVKYKRSLSNSDGTNLLNIVSHSQLYAEGTERKAVQLMKAQYKENKAKHWDQQPASEFVRLIADELKDKTKAERLRGIADGIKAHETGKAKASV